MKNVENTTKAPKKAKTGKKRSIKRPIRSLKEKEGMEVPPEQLETEKEVKLEDRGLRLAWVKFLDAYIANNGNGTEAYMIAYPDVIDEKVAQAAASRLLSNVMVQEELHNKLEAQRVTEESIVNLGLAYAHAGLGSEKMSMAGAKALEMLAKMKGLLVDTKKIAFTGDNPAVFAPLYSKEEKEAMDKAFKPGDGKVIVRIIE